ncbi:hypothetical protein CDAR_563231 [Caerostris darwini]|uniref:Uncharacterized protein n=1 Tax=Caerostris darwini TaxID=1538125 RepID=A0AAV4UW08_9ARAC|nr:hypothetical protein CDAR_563231 [Caerostris darwini]
MKRGLISIELRKRYASCQGGSIGKFVYAPLRVGRQFCALIYGTFRIGGAFMRTLFPLSSAVNCRKRFTDARDWAKGFIFLRFGDEKTRPAILLLMKYWRCSSDLATFAVEQMATKSVEKSYNYEFP